MIKYQIEEELYERINYRYSPFKYIGLLRSKQYVLKTCLFSTTIALFIDLATKNELISSFMFYLILFPILFIMFITDYCRVFFGVKSEFKYVKTFKFTRPFHFFKTTNKIYKKEQMKYIRTIYHSNLYDSFSAYADEQLSTLKNKNIFKFVLLGIVMSTLLAKVVDFIYKDFLGEINYEILKPERLQNYGAIFIFLLILYCLIKYSIYSQKKGYENSEKLKLQQTLKLIQQIENEISI